MDKAVLDRRRPGSSTARASTTWSTRSPSTSSGAGCPWSSATAGSRTSSVTKGAVEEVLIALCTSQPRTARGRCSLTDALRAHSTRSSRSTTSAGLRVLAVAIRAIDRRRTNEPTVARRDEERMTLVGFLAFLDPPKAPTPPGPGLRRAGHHRGQGDHRRQRARRARSAAKWVSRSHRGRRRDIDGLDDARAGRARPTTVFAKVNPAPEGPDRRALQADGHTVGFLGDGINDAPALRAADVGISVDTAVDIAKESADIILLEKDLTVLEQGVIEGRDHLRQHDQVHQDDRPVPTSATSSRCWWRAPFSRSRRCSRCSSWCRTSLYAPRELATPVGRRRRGVPAQAAQVGRQRASAAS